ncbi:hypothetical protein FOA52_007476 [Chlamydomonas sp. UWO 241]|nr:hypothetical protein FOA52_007476 [Chlamydomonas sp. UWO 241]
MATAGGVKRTAVEMEAGSSGRGGDAAMWSASFTWRIENFSTLTSEVLLSAGFEAGICTWRLSLHPEGTDDGAGTHLSVYLEAQDDMWKPRAEYKITAVNQADASSPTLRVDGSFGAWTYIQSYLYLLHDQPKLTLSSVQILLPVAHKYNFAKLIKRLMAFAEESSEELHTDPDAPGAYIIQWLALAGRLQLDELPGEMEAGSSGRGGYDAMWSASFTWRIENFSTLTSEMLLSDCFESGISTWRLKVYPEGTDDGAGTHLSVYIEAQDVMWKPRAEYKITAVNQADSSKSSSAGSTETFDGEGWGFDNFVELSSLRSASAGWLMNDTLVLTVDVTVEREPRFQVDTDGVPCDMTLKLACGAEVPVISQFLQVASPFFRGALDDMRGNAPIPVDGSLGTWTYMQSCLYPFHNQPKLTLGSVFTLLPVAHKYDFAKLLARLMAFIKKKIEELHSDPDAPSTYIIPWLALAESLQLDELRELCLMRLHDMTKQQLQRAISVEVEEGSGADKHTRRILRSQVKALGHEQRDKLLLLAVSALTS